MSSPARVRATLVDPPILTHALSSGTPRDPRTDGPHTDGKPVLAISPHLYGQGALVPILSRKQRTVLVLPMRAPFLRAALGAIDSGDCVEHRASGPSCYPVRVGHRGALTVIVRLLQPGVRMNVVSPGSAIGTQRLPYRPAYGW